MICYRDMTFCGYDKCEKFNDCFRALTDEVKEKAKKWWNDIDGEPPICQWAETPDCFVKATPVLDFLGNVAGAFIEESNEAMGMT